MGRHTTDYLIIGNSAAGVTAAEYIRATDSEGSILIISKEPYPVYGRPLISYLIEGKTTEEEIGFKDPGFYESNAFDTLLGGDYEATSLDAAAHSVTLKNGDTVTYGKCLVATGSVAFTPPIKGLDGKENVFTFLSLDDAKDAWKAALAATEKARSEQRKSRLVVIGAGLIGLKAAEALSGHVDDVVVLELAPRILPAILDDQGAAILTRQLAERGITCMPGISAEEMFGEGARITGAKLTNGDEIVCDLVIAAVGVRPNTTLAAEAGAQQGRGLVCGEDLQTTLPDVYAAGDVTEVTDLLDGSKHPLALWPNALRQGKVAGQFMAASPQAEPFRGNFAVNAVDFFDISLLTGGVINPPEGGGYEVDEKVDGKAYARFITKDDRLMGYILLNRPVNAGIYTEIIERGMPLSSLSDDLFDEAPVNLDFPTDVRWERLHKRYPSDLDERGWSERAWKEKIR